MSIVAFIPSGTLVVRSFIPGKRLFDCQSAGQLLPAIA
jgi:hypothetical protein